MTDAEHYARLNGLPAPAHPPNCLCEVCILRDELRITTALLAEALPHVKEECGLDDCNICPRTRDLQGRIRAALEVAYV